MKVEVQDLEKRMSSIEDKLDLIVDNHLKHLRSAVARLQKQISSLAKAGRRIPQSLIDRRVSLGKKKTIKTKRR